MRGLVLGALLLATALAGCASASRGEYTSRWSPDAAPRTAALEPGLELRYLKVGNGPPLVLLHTLRTQLDYFQKVIPLLQNRYTVYAVDLPGHGQSTIGGADYDEPYFRRAVARFIEVLDLRAVTLAGESIGGTLALTVAADAPERIARVVSVNPYDGGEDFGGSIRRSRSGWIVGLFALFGRYTIETRTFLDKVLEGTVDDPASLPGALKEEFRRTGRRPGYRSAEYSVFANWRSWIEARALYGKVRAPVTLVYSEHDWSSVEERRRDRAALPGACHVVVARAGHFASLDQPVEVARAILGRALSMEVAC